MDPSDPTDTQRRQAIAERAINVRDTWLALARILRANPEKAMLAAVRSRRCYQLSRLAEGFAVFVWHAHFPQLAELERQLDELAARADRAMVAIGMAGHEPQR